MTFLVRIAMVVAVLTALAAAAAAASDHDDARNAVQAGRALPLGAIVGQVGRSYPGRLLDADMRKGKGDSLVYVLRWLTPEGNVLNMTVDAASGRVLGVKGKH
ncbi:MAG: hypothetical protein GY791_11130 [Alphaproteobacteria bacterium]|nr:hypothetical protein [Alphaproteobacteria bacterium]